MAVRSTPAPVVKHQFLTAAALSRRLDVPYTSLRDLAARGELPPDAIADQRTWLWKVERVSQVAELLSRLLGRPCQSAARGDRAT